MGGGVGVGGGGIFLLGEAKYKRRAKKHSQDVRRKRNPGAAENSAGLISQEPAYPRQFMDTSSPKPLFASLKRKPNC